MSLGGKNHRRLAAATGSSILLDFHFREERLYWADRRTGIIYKASVQGARRQVVMQKCSRVPTNSQKSRANPLLCVSIYDQVYKA